ncbi:MAG TPA: AmpG family muropeptide MFS transporter [Longimicrobiaceae bacterium]|nr:AmpG family muropeptide MFS transporter [Longimicrobiaceae bacterium]
MVVLLFLGFSSGLPLYLTSRTLQAWMTTEGVTLTAIGLFSLVGLPYSLKFLWSPLLDRYVPPRLGRRRGWLVLTQVALLVAIGAMALQDPGRALELLALNAVLIAFFSATQDIAFNAYQVDVLEEREMGAGAAVGVLGYRIALLVTGSAAFILADRLTWPTVYLLISVLMLVGVVAAVLAPEPALRGQPPETLGDAVRLPLRDFFVRIGRSQAIAVLAFVILYKLGDALAASMITPFLIQTGFRQAQIGTVQGGLGLLATIVGVVAGGGMLSRLGIPRSLWVFGGVQAGSNLAYLVLAQLGPSYGILVAAVLVENFSAGLGTAALVAYLMSLCSPRFSATQFALLSSLTAVSRDLLASPAGAIAQVTGWPLFFLLTLVAGIPGLLLLPIVAPWHRRSVRQMDSGPPAALPAEAT